MKRQHGHGKKRMKSWHRRSEARYLARFERLLREVVAERERQAL